MKTHKSTVSDGTQSLYDVDFDLGYLDKTHVYVYAGTDNSLYETQLEYVWQNDTQIELTNQNEYPVGTVINIRRVVPRDDLYVTYKNSVGINETNLNEGNLQALMLIEEQDDGFKPDAYTEKQDMNFAGLYTVKNLAPAEENGEPLVYEQLFDAQNSISATILQEARVEVDKAEGFAEDAADSAASLDTLIDEFNTVYLPAIPDLQAEVLAIRADLENRVYAGTSVGAIHFFSVDAVPDWVLVMDGSSYEPSEYPALFALYGYTHGNDNGKFRVPNASGRTFRMVDGGEGVDLGPTRVRGDGTTGDNVGSLQGDATKMPNTPFETDYEAAHYHGSSATTGSSEVGVDSDGADTNVANDGTRTGSAGGHSHAIIGGDTETTMKNISVVACVEW